MASNTCTIHGLNLPCYLCFEERVAPEVMGVADIVSEVFFGDFLKRNGFVDKDEEEDVITVQAEPSECQTCRGKGRVGFLGHEVQCPVCKR